MFALHVSPFAVVYPVAIADAGIIGEIKCCKGYGEVAFIGVEGKGIGITYSQLWLSAPYMQLCEHEGWYVASGV